MRPEKKTTKDFYRHSETGQLTVIEKRPDGVIVGSCPAQEPLKDLDSYQCKADNNIWICDQSDKLILWEPGA